MGNWFETCMVSHLPILGGEKCAAVILIGQKYPGIGSYATDEYASLAVIRGKYNEYGSLEEYDPVEASALLSALSTLGLKVSECGEMKDYEVSTLEDFIDKVDSGLYSAYETSLNGASGSGKPLPLRIVFVREGMLGLAQPGTDGRNVLDKAFASDNGRMRMRNLSISMSCGQISYLCCAFLKTFREANSDAAYKSTEKVLGLNRLLNQLRMSWHIPSGKGNQCALTEDMVLFGVTYMRELKAIDDFCSEQ